MKPNTLLLILVTLLSATPWTSGAETSNELLQRGLLEEEANHNLPAAIQAYQSVIEQFNSQRKDAATAVLRLAECYRKLGQTNEAVAEYRRVIREFSDQPGLVDPGERGLTALGANSNQSVGGSASSRAPTITDPEQLKLLLQEIQLVEKEISAAEAKFNNGKGEFGEIVRAKRDLLSLQRQLPENASTPAQKKLVLQQIQAVEQLLAEKRKQIEVGAAPPLDTVPLERTLIGLRRELIAVESPDNGPGRAVSTAAQNLSDDDSKEIQRLQGMIRNSPDLINSPSFASGETPLADAAARGRIEVARFLLANKADVNGRSNSGTALHRAAFNGHKTVVDLLLANGADVNARDSTGATPLHHASEKGFLIVAQALLAKGADPNSRDASRQTPLGKAAAKGHTRVIELLVNGKADVNAADSTGATPLFWASLRNDLSPAKLLLEHGADPSVGNSRGTPLGLAIMNDNRELIELLLTKGADVNATGAVIKWSDGNQDHTAQGVPLVAAMSRGDTNLVVWLLDHKADVNAAGEGGQQPLHYAVQLNREDMARLLLARGANINAKTSYGFTPLVLAMIAGKSPFIELLLAKGADPSIDNSEGVTALLRSMTLGSTTLVEMLLAHKADPNQKSVNGYTPLHSAAATGNIEAAKLLLAKGAEVNARDEFWNTPLHYAAFNGRRAMVELLLANKADVSILNRANQSPMAMTDSRLLGATSYSWGIPTNIGMTGSGGRPQVPERTAIAELLKQRSTKE